MDPDRPIERLLRACAEKRRQQAQLPSEVHPATRRLLQGEVARRLGGSAASQPKHWWSLLISMPRLALVASGAAVVLLLALVVLPPGRTRHQLLARNDRASESLSPPAQPQQPVAAPAAAEALSAPNQPTELQVDKSKALALSTAASQRAEETEKAAMAAGGAKPEAAAMFAANAPAVQAVTNGQAASGMLAGNAAPAGEPIALRTDALQAPAAAVAPAAARAATRVAGTMAPPPSAPQPDVALMKPNAAASQVLSDSRDSLSFAQTGGPMVPTFIRIPADARLASRAAKLPADTVLRSFKFKQAGDMVQVIDQDGSVYTGSLQMALAEDRLRSVSADGDRTQVNRRFGLQSSPAARQPLAVAQKAPAGYYFRVAGTNKSLNQKVVFTGSLWPPTNGVGQVESTNRFGVPGQSWLFNSRVSGKAVINDRQQLDINAAPATR